MALSIRYTDKLLIHLRPTNKTYTTHRLLLGTHTSGQAQDYLQIATVQIPKRDGLAGGADKLDRGDYDDERGELGGHTIPPAPRIQIIQKINHAGEVNRARYMPQNPNLLATKAVTGEVLVFDRTKHSSEPERGGVCKPDIRLVGQTREGWVSFFLMRLLRSLMSWSVLDLLGARPKLGMSWEPLKI
jgi:histone-binding protein RBBP4